MSLFAESLRRLYRSGTVKAAKLISLYQAGKITKSEYDSITVQTGPHCYDSK